MSKITASTLVLGDNTTITSKYSVIPKNTRMVFYQASAPTGWTTLSLAERTIRIVSGTGGGSGGTIDFLVALNNSSSDYNVPLTINSLSLGDTTLSTPQIPTHSHNINGGSPDSRFGPPTPAGTTRNGMDPSSAPTGNYGGGGSHTHPISYTSANASSNLTYDIRVRYSNVLLCQRS